MGLQNTFKTAAGTIFKALGDIPESVNLYALGSTSYNASSGVVSASSTSQSVKMIVDKFSVKEIDNDKVKPGDIKGLVVYSSVTGVPTVDDYIVRIEAGASVRYDVVNYESDPAFAVYIFQLRKP